MQRMNFLNNCVPGFLFHWSYFFYNKLEMKMPRKCEISNLIKGFDNFIKKKLNETKMVFVFFLFFQQMKYYTQINVRSSRGKNAKGRKITGIEAYPGEDKVTGVMGGAWRRGGWGGHRCVPIGR